MSTLCDGVTLTCCQREAQGRRRPETTSENGTATQEDDTSAASKRHIERADRHDITPKDVTPRCVCMLCVLCL